MPPAYPPPQCFLHNENMLAKKNSITLDSTEVKRLPNINNVVGAFVMLLSGCKKLESLGLVPSDLLDLQYCPR